MNRRKIIYFQMIWKKGLMVVPRLLLTLLVTALFLGGTAFLLYTAAGDDQVFPGVDVAVVTESPDFTISMGTRLVQSMESVSSVCRFHEVREEEAIEGLKNGRFQAAAYLPLNIYDDVNEGVNTPVRIQIPSESLLSLSIFRDLVDSGLSILQIGESAVYAIYDACYLYDSETAPEGLANRISADFTTRALQRGIVFDVSVISPYGDISIPVFYTITAVLVLLCVFLGTAFSGLYTGENQAVRCCLMREGIGETAQGLARISIVSLVLWGFLCIVYGILALFTDFTVFRPVSLLYLWALAFSLAGFFHLIYSLVPEEAKSLFFLLSGILIFLLGGGLFPDSMLPELLAFVPRILPVRIWQGFLSSIFMGRNGTAFLLRALFAGALMAAAGTVLNHLWKKRGFEHA